MKDDRLRAEDVVVGGTYSVNRKGDFYMLSTARPFIGRNVTVLQKNKSGLYLVELPGGRKLSVALFRLSPAIVEEEPKHE